MQTVRKNVATLALIGVVWGLAAAHAAPAATTRTLSAADANNAAVAALERGQLDEAVAQLRSAHALAPANAAILRNLTGALDRRAKRRSEAGQFDEAERDYLEAVTLDSSDTKTVAHFAAFLNNRAVAFLRAGRLEEAQRRFERAEQYLPRLADANQRAQIQKNYAHFLVTAGDALAEGQQPDQARACYRAALARDPAAADALVSLADLDYDADQYAAALEGYQRALAAATGPDQDRLGANLRQRIDTLRKEMALESGFLTIRDQLGRFEATFPKELSKAVVAGVLQTLNDAYQKVGRDFGYYPRRTVRVKIYTRAQLNAIQQIPPWVSGYFDGKLRLLEERLGGGPAALRGSILHEYTHAVIYFLAGDLVPSWLHEGLAQLEDPSRAVTPSDRRELAARARTGGLIPLADLIQPFERNESSDRARLTYVQTRAFVGYVVQRHGWEKVRAVLRQTRRLRDFDAAFSAAYGKTPAEMEEEWKGALKEER